MQFYQAYLSAVIRNMGVEASSIEDIKQSVLLKAWEKLPEFNYDPAKGRFRSWLNTVTINTVRNKVAKEGRLKKFLESEHAIKLQRYLKEESKAEVEELAEKEWKRHVSESAWNTVKAELPVNFQQIFEMHMEGKEIKDIAAQLNLAENSVYVYRKRVQKMIVAEIYRLEQELG